MYMNKTKRFLSSTAAVTLAACIWSSAAFAASAAPPHPAKPYEPAPNSSGPGTGMQFSKKIYPIESKSFYRITSSGTVEFADRDDGTGWLAVPSAYIKGSSYNKENIDYGIYLTGAASSLQAHFVDTKLGALDQHGVLWWTHGTADGATVSGEQDSADNADPTMSTFFSMNIENGIGGDTPEHEVVIPGMSNDRRVGYEVTVATKSHYQLKATVPMYVCMYGYRASGSVIGPKPESYALRNTSTVNAGNEATVVDIVKLTHYAKLYDANHSDEELHSIAYNKQTHEYRYWYSAPSDAMGPEWERIVIKDKHINATGEMYVFAYVDGKGAVQWDFKAAGVLDGDALRQSVDKIDPLFPLKSDFIHDGFNFGKTFSVGAVAHNGTKWDGLALKVSEIQAIPATWRLVNNTTRPAALKAGEIAMTIAPQSALQDASAIDLADASAPLDITDRGWYLAAPDSAAVDGTGTVKPADAKSLNLMVGARIAGGNVNDPGCTSVVQVRYTLIPLFGPSDSQTSTDPVQGAGSNRS